MKRSFYLLSFLCLFTSLCSSAEKVCKDYITVIISNPRNTDARSEMVEMVIAELDKYLPSPFHYIINPQGKEIPSQRTHDGKIIFKADVSGKGSVTYKVFPSEKEHTYTSTVSGSVYPERADDVAWENEKGGYRVYGSATRKKGEMAYGHDIFFKHPQKQLILPILYREVTSLKNRCILDSLKRMNPKKAKHFSKSISYHIDHGLGMDCYAVGPTLGAGATALIQGDSLLFSGCYDKVEILDNGPLRFTCRLDFPTIMMTNNQSVTEHRLITLDSETNLNHCCVWYDGLNSNTLITTGFPLRDTTEVYADKKYGIVAYSDPTQGKNNGRALLGIILTHKPFTIEKQYGHILAQTKHIPKGIFEYYWGFAWDKEAPFDFDGWYNLLRQIRDINKKPLKLKIQK